MNDDVQIFKNINSINDKKIIIEENYLKITQLKTHILSLKENIIHLNEIRSNINYEITSRKEYQELLKKQYEDIYECQFEKNKKSSHLEEIKNNIIRKRMRELLEERIPTKSQLREKNEFFNLVFKSINVFLSKYSKYTKKFEKECSASFIINKTTTFSSLKSQISAVWKIRNTKEYILTDMNEAIINDENMIIDLYMREYSLCSNSFRLVSIEAMSSRLNLIPIQSIAIKEMNNGLKKRDNENNELSYDDNRTTDKKILHEIKHFFFDYTAFQPFIKDDNRMNFKLRVPPERGHTSFFMLFVLVVFFILNNIFIYKLRDIVYINKNIEFLNTLFDNKKVDSYHTFKNYLINDLGKYVFDNLLPKCPNDISINTNCVNLPLIVPYEKIDKFILDSNFTDKDTVKNTIDLYNFNSYLTSSNYANISDTMDKINLKTKSAFENSIVSTYYATFNEDASVSKFAKKFLNITIETIKNNDSIFYSGLRNLNTYKTALESNISLNIYGLNGHYDGSGFHGDINSFTTFIIIKISFTQFKNFIEKYINYEKQVDDNTNSITLIDQSTRSMFFLFGLFFPGSNTWMKVCIPFEMLANGRIYPLNINTKLFSPIFYQTYGLIIIDFFRGIIVLILLFFFIQEILDKKMEIIESLVENPVNYALSLIIPITYFYSLYYKIKQNIKFEDYFEETQFRDTYLMENWYSNVYFLETLLFWLVSLMTLVLLKLNSNIRTFHQSIKLFIIIYIKYLIFLVGLLCIYGAICHIIWGPYINQFASFSASFAQLFLISMGYYNISELTKYNSGWGVTILLSFFIIVIIFLFSVFISIYAESFRNTVIQTGYPQDERSNKWKLKDFLIWLCYCYKNEKSNN